jgi:predicted transcriptional regulator
LIKRLQHGLSKRERQIMNAIYSRKAATASEVWKSIPSPPSYSAVRATLKILENKGMLSHSKQGRKYLYLPTIPHQRARLSALRQLVDTFFEGSVEATVAALIRADSKKLTDAEYGRLIDLIRGAAKEKGK